MNKEMPHNLIEPKKIIVIVNQRQDTMLHKCYTVSNSGNKVGLNSLEGKSQGHRCHLHIPGVLLVRSGTKMV